MVNEMTDGRPGYQPRPARKRDGSMGVTRSGDGKCKRSVEPSLASIGDAHFNIGRAAGVPEEHTKQFYALLARGVTLEGVPEHLLVYRNETYVPASV